MDDYETTLIGLSGKKGSGKSTSVSFLLGLYLVELGLIVKAQKDPESSDTKYQGGFSITPKGELWVSNLFGDSDYQGVFDYSRQSDSMEEFKKKHLDPYIKIYSFADLLKKEVCIKILGLTYEQCYGTNEEKDSKTRLCWKNMPGYSGGYSDIDFMSTRQVLQYVGTNIFCKMYGNVWVDAIIRQIKKDKPIVAIVSDIRFPNEVQGVHDAGGKVIRLTRDPFLNQDEHESEIILNADVYDWNNFDKILDNSTCTIKQQNQLLYLALAPYGVIPDLYADIMKTENCEEISGKTS